MESYTNACWELFYQSIVGVVVEEDDTETLDFLKEKYLNSINKNQAKHPSFGVTNSNSKSTSTGTRTRAPSAYNLYYQQWKKENTDDEFDNPDNPGQKVKPRAYFLDYVWGKKTDAEKAEIKKQFQTNQPTKERKDFSAFGFFKDRHRSLLEEAFTAKELENLKHPVKKAPITLYRFIQFLWTDHVNKDATLKKEFDDLSKDMKDRLSKGKPTDFDLTALPHLDIEQVKSFDFENLQMVHD